MTAYDPATNSWASVTLEGGRVAAVTPCGPPAPGEPVLTPRGFDVQVNGALGVDFSTPDLPCEAVWRVTNWLADQHVGGTLPTLVTGPLERMRACLVSLVRTTDRDPALANVINGFHLEGPFISRVDGYRGAHPAEFCLLPDPDVMKSLWDASDGRIRLVTLAPELPGALALTEQLVRLGVTVAIGHTTATAAQIDDAASAGARLVTHLGNGIARTIDRHANPLWAELAHPKLTASVIADGFHLPAELLRSVVGLKPSRWLLTSDASPLAGCAPGDYDLWGQPVTVDADGVPRVPGTGYLAGAGHGPGRALDYLAGVGVPELAILEAFAVTPRRLLSLPVPVLQVGGTVEEFVTRPRR